MYSKANSEVFFSLFTRSYLVPSFLQGCGPVDEIECCSCCLFELQAEYMDPKTLWSRAVDAIDTIIRRDDANESQDLLQPCIEGTHPPLIINGLFEYVHMYFVTHL